MDSFDFEFLTLTTGMVGLFFICCAVVQKKPKHILEEHFGLYSGGLRHVKSWVFKRNQLVLGFALVVIGGIVKIFGHSMSRPDGLGILDRHNPVVVALSLVTFMIALCAILYYFCRVWSKRDFRRIVTEVVQEHRWPFDSNLALAVEIGHLLGLPRKADDTVEEYVASLRAHLQLPLIEPTPTRPARSSKIGLEFR